MGIIKNINWDATPFFERLTAQNRLAQAEHLVNGGALLVRVKVMNFHKLFYRNMHMLKIQVAAVEQNS